MTKQIGLCTALPPFDPSAFAPPDALEAVGIPSLFWKPGSTRNLESARSAANIAFTGDSNALLVVDDSDRKKVSRWSFLTGEVVPLGHGFNGEILFLSLSADGRVLVASDDASRNLAFGMPDGNLYAHIDFPGMVVP